MSSELESNVCYCVWLAPSGENYEGNHRRLAESNGSLPPGGWLSHVPADCMYVHWDQLRAQRLVTSVGKVYLYLFFLA